jgi:ABC-type uncharacterized transport system involved in gliding motility auxiliary subunit
MNSGKLQANALGLIAIAACVLIAIALNNTLLRGLRVDLTENRLYTLTDGTKEILESIDEPVNLYLYFSEQAAQDLPFLGTYAQRVEELLLEFRQVAGDQLNVKIIDPAPFSEDEDRATGFGLQGISLSLGGDPVFFGLAGTNAVGDEATIPIFDPNKEAFLEYDIARLVYELANPDKPIVGILSNLPVRGGNFDPMTQQVQPGWVFTEQLEQLYEIRYLEPDTQTLDADIDALLLVHPKQPAPNLQYAIDQFVLRGGRLIVFVDPYSDFESIASMGQAMGGTQLNNSNLNNLLENWGVTIPAGEVVGDLSNALQVQSAMGLPVRHIGLIGLRDTGIDTDDIITAGLETINLGYSGVIEQTEAATTTLMPLLSTSAEANLLPIELLGMAQQDPTVLQQGFVPSGQVYVLAGRVSGKVSSAFPATPEGYTGTESHLAESVADVNIIVVADTDILSDRFWVQAQNFFGQRLVTAFASNGDFVGNAIDNMLGSEALIGMRGRATFNRPFIRVESLQREAEAEFQLKEEQLQQQLAETEQRLNELQAEEGANGALILSSEQQAELDRFQNERLRIRKELRNVQSGLRSDIEGLGNWLKMLNIALMPLVFMLLAIGVAALRRSRAA